MWSIASVLAVGSIGDREIGVEPVGMKATDASGTDIWKWSAVSWKRS